ncbi:MAG: hypothetical protein PHI97_25155 [Desulfobulbus sp.]|nr:hypothetical protein [Desulfobulbus sp.]
MSNKFIMNKPLEQLAFGKTIIQFDRTGDHHSAHEASIHSKTNDQPPLGAPRRQQAGQGRTWGSLKH